MVYKSVDHGKLWSICWLYLFYKRYYHDALIDLEYFWLDFYFQLSINQQMVAILWSDLAGNGKTCVNLS